jgi:hypothetical protein
MADMVGSGNTNPPSIALLAFAAAQAGLVPAAGPWVSALLARPGPWQWVRRLNSRIMNVYRWHFVPAIVIAVAFYAVLRLPAGLGRPGQWSPVLLAAGLAASGVGLTRLAIADFAPGGHVPVLVLASCAVGLAATPFTGRAPAAGAEPRALPPGRATAGRALRRRWHTWPGRSSCGPSAAVSARRQQ